MTDIKDNTHFEDDFQFDDMDHHESAFDSKPQNVAGTPGLNDSAFNGLNNKNPRKLILIGIILVLIIAFVIYHFATRSSNPLGDIKPQNTAPASQAAATPSANMADSSVATAPVSIAATSAQPTPAAGLDDKISKLEQTINQQQATIETLQGNITTLQDSINSLNSSVSSMTGQLTTAIKHLPKPAPKKAVVQANVPPPVTYIVKALVPGRAWLQGSDGSTLSVAVGNNVPDHGTVTNIDLNAGQVTMSDGTVFSYDINGN